MNRIRSGKQFLGFRRNHQTPSYAKIEIGNRSNIKIEFVKAVKRSFLESQNKINEVRSRLIKEKSLYEEMSDNLKPTDSILISGQEYRKIIIKTTNIFLFLTILTIIFKEMTEPGTFKKQNNVFNYILGGYGHHSESLRWIPFMERQFECDRIIDRGLIENLKLKIRHFDDGVFDKKKQ